MNTIFDIQEVKSPQTQEEFLRLPAKLYKGDKNWIHPLKEDIQNIFDPTKNKHFQHGECTRWILTNQNGETIGRVAAFIDHKTKDLNDQPTGGMGFFECINNKEAAFQLFDQCKNWLKERNIEAMDGPINFGERHQWWGLLIDGFDYPNYGMPYHHSYYKDFFEEYGFQIYFKQYTYKTQFNPENLSKILVWKADRIFSNPKYRVIHFKKNESERFIKDFTEVYNKAWAKDIPGIDGIEPIQAQELFKSIQDIIEEKLMWFAYYEDQVIGFFIMMPDFNQILKHLKGKITLWGKLLFLYYKYIKKNQKALGLIFGVIPEYQSKGIEAALIKTFSDVGFSPKFQFKQLEMNWIGDFNPRMMHLMEHIGAKIHKTHITYRKLFDPNKPFKRAEIIK
ncbi:MAG: hypothetical protein ACEPOZ_05735 [Marinifilaceae bacterium]|jgi:GNAT superfamily N-acetyltransferase